MNMKPQCKQYIYTYMQTVQTLPCYTVSVYYYWFTLHRTHQQNLVLLMHWCFLVHVCHVVWLKHWGSSYSISSYSFTVDAHWCGVVVIPVYMCVCHCNCSGTDLQHLDWDFSQKSLTKWAHAAVVGGVRPWEELLWVFVRVHFVGGWI